MTANLKLVLRTYSALRQMSPDDIALLETLRGLNDGDRELMVETLQGKATTKKASKKSSKSSQSSSKSSRASGMAAQLNKNLKQQRRSIADDSDDDNRFDGKSAQETRRELLQDIDDGDSYCTHQYEHDGIMIECGEPADQNIHHLRTVEGYHPFVSTVPPAPVSSSANGGAVDESASAAGGD